MLVISAVPLNS